MDILDINSKPQIGTNTNVRFGFSDMTQWEKNNPGDIEFHCEFCGVYIASIPRCKKCEVDHN